MTNRIKYIDGLKGLCGIWICVFHYILAFIPLGYIGWQSGVADENRASVYFHYFPFSILSNGSFPLYIFFALIAFVPALRYFTTGEEQGIKRQAVQRYFRFMPPILVCVLSAYAVYACHLFYNQQLAIDANSNWDKAFYPSTISWMGAVKAGFYGSIFQGNSDYCSPLWCMNIIFLGSYIVYAVLLFFGDLKNRYIVYVLLFLLSLTIPIYTSFLLGIVAADIAAHASTIKGDNLKLGLGLILAGLIIGNFPEVLLAPFGISVYTAYGIGSFSLILGCSTATKITTILSARWLCYAGRISFSLILVHFTIMMSFSAGLFHYCKAHDIPDALNILLTWIAAIPAILITSMLFEKFIERPTGALSTWIYTKLSVRD